MATDYKHAKNIRSRFRIGVRWHAAATAWKQIESRLLLRAEQELDTTAHAEEQLQESRRSFLNLENRTALGRLYDGSGGFENFTCAMAALPIDWAQLGKFPCREELAIAGYQCAELAYRTGKTLPSGNNPFVDRLVIYAVLYVAGSIAFLNRLASVSDSSGQGSSFELFTDSDWVQILAEIKPRLTEEQKGVFDYEYLKLAMLKFGESIIACRNAIPDMENKTEGHNWLNSMKWLGSAEKASETTDG